MRQIICCGPWPFRLIRAFGATWGSIVARKASEEGHWEGGGVLEFAGNYRGGVGGLSVLWWKVFRFGGAYNATGCGLVVGSF